MCDLRNPVHTSHGEVQIRFRAYIVPELGVQRQAGYKSNVTVIQQIQVGEYRSE